MGLLDFPAPVFAWMDAVLFGQAPALVRLALWALLISALSMAIYARLSPQAELKRLKTEIRAGHRDLHAHDGDFSGLMTIAARTVGLSLRHVRLIAPPALAACIPVIVLLVWLAKAYGPAPTESGLPLQMKVTGGGASLRIVSPEQDSDGAPPPAALLVVFGDNGALIAQAPLSPALTRLEKRRWWHWLAGSPAGYLPPDAPIDAVHVRWPRYETHHLGPAWVRFWETPFLAFAIVFTLGIQAAFRIE